MKAKFRHKIGAMVGQVLSSMLKKTATINYPFTKFEMPLNFRGKLVFLKEKCIGCKICERACPSGALEVVKKDPRDKEFDFIIRLGNCIYCAQCVDVCPKKALETSREYEIAQLNKDKLIETYHVANAPAEPVKAS